MFPISSEARALGEELNAFMDEKVYPLERKILGDWEAGMLGWARGPDFDRLKHAARATRLWNLFIPERQGRASLSVLEYAGMCETMGRVHFGAELFNCSAPDTGNMELLEKFGTDEQKKRWLEPLLAGEIRSSFAMTEPAVASSDATNISTTIIRDGDDYVINGRKWWISGAASDICTMLVVLGRSRPEADRHSQHSMILVPKDAPGVRIVRTLSLMGYDDRPHGHCEILFDNVRVPTSNLLGEEGRGFAMSQERLGPGRVHHCMRMIGVAERAIETMCRRVSSRVAFGKPLSRNDVVRQSIARSRIEVEQARLLVLKTSYMIDTVGARGALSEIAAIKALVPEMTQRVVERAMHVHGAAGLTEDHFLAYAFARSRALRFADGPDDVHLRTVARLELKRQVPEPADG